MGFTGTAFTKAKTRLTRRHGVGGALCAFTLSLLALALSPSQASASRAISPVVPQRPVVAEIVVKPKDFGTISKYLFGTNLLWADDAEGAFNPATGRFYSGFVSASLSSATRGAPPPTVSTGSGPLARRRTASSTSLTACRGPSCPVSRTDPGQTPNRLVSVLIDGRLGHRVPARLQLVELGPHHLVALARGCL